MAFWLLGFGLRLPIPCDAFVREAELLHNCAYTVFLLARVQLGRLDVRNLGVLEPHGVVVLWGRPEFSLPPEDDAALVHGFAGGVSLVEQRRRHVGLFGDREREVFAIAGHSTRLRVPTATDLV